MQECTSQLLDLKWPAPHSLPLHHPPPHHPWQSKIQIFLFSDRLLKQERTKISPRYISQASQTQDRDRDRDRELRGERGITETVMRPLSVADLALTAWGNSHWAKTQALEEISLKTWRIFFYPSTEHPQVFLSKLTPLSWQLSVLAFPWPAMWRMNKTQALKRI